MEKYKQEVLEEQAQVDPLCSCGMDKLYTPWPLTLWMGERWWILSRLLFVEYRVTGIIVGIFKEMKTLYFPK